jgi:hypothetical protein
MAEEIGIDSEEEQPSADEITQSHPLLDEWSSYILSRREQYATERVAIIGREYDSNKRAWDNIIEREWMIMEERLRGGLGVDREMKEYFGNNFFKNDEALIAEAIELTANFPTTSVVFGETNRELKIYTFEDFLMLSNQGIFREDNFLLDPQSKWKRKIAKSVSEYGYSQTQTLFMEGEKYYVISRR